MVLSLKERNKLMKEIVEKLEEDLKEYYDKDIAEVSKLWERVTKLEKAVKELEA